MYPGSYILYAFSSFDFLTLGISEYYMSVLIWNRVQDFANHIVAGFY